MNYKKNVVLDIGWTMRIIYDIKCYINLINARIKVHKIPGCGSTTHF